MLEISRGEIAIVAFIFALVYGGLWSPRIGERVALMLSRAPKE